MEYAELILTLFGTTFAGLCWYYEYQKRKEKRNNPPSRDSKTDRYVG
ncbi:hypothetical protein [Cytobacillus oceanisediminis]